MDRLLTIALNGGIASRALRPSVWVQIRDAGINDAPALISWAEKYLKKDDLERVRDSVDNLEATRRKLAAYEKLGVGAITEFESAYPQKWKLKLAHSGRASSPAVAFYCGDLVFLESKALVVTGPRKADEHTAEFAKAAVEHAVNAGLAACTGGAHGVAQIVLDSAMEYGGKAIKLVSHGLLEIAAQRRNHELYLSAAAPESGFNIGTTMGKHKLMYALGEAAVVAACTEGRGGTWSGAVEALKLGLAPIFVRMDATAPPGNAALVRLGAVPIRTPAEVFEIRDLQPKLGI